MDKHHGEKTNAGDSAACAIGKSSGLHEPLQIGGVYHVRCFDRNGKLKWEDEINNLVTTEGKDEALDQFLNGSGYTAAFYLGLISATGYGAGPAVGDTMASHAGWTEEQNYDEAARLTPSWNASSAGSKAANALSFSINASVTAKGAFLTTNATKGGTTGILYSAGLFTGGDKALVNGETLQVTYTASLT